MRPSPTLLTELECAAIGGIGGSGTRAIALVFQKLGLDIGFDLNESLDDLTFTALMKDDSLLPLAGNTRLIADRLGIFVAARVDPGRDSTTFPAEDYQRNIAADFESSLPTANESRPWQRAAFQRDRVQAIQERKFNAELPLIWKEPNTHILIPALLELLPGLNYVHVLRNGLDMAWSNNQNQLTLWGSVLLGRPIDPRSPQDSFDYWCVSTERICKLQEQFPQRVSTICIENIAEEPESLLGLLKRLIGAKGAEIPDRKLLKLIRDVVVSPDTIGRHRDHASLIISESQRLILARAGYDLPA